MREKSEQSYETEAYNLRKRKMPCSEIAKKFDVSESTIYRWCKKITTREDFYKLTKDIRNNSFTEEKLKKLEELAKKLKSDAKIQSQLMTIYINQGKDVAAKEIAERFPNNAVIQSQLMAIYINQGNDAAAKEIAEKFPTNEVIQNQLAKRYIHMHKIEEANNVLGGFNNNYSRSQKATINQIKGNKVPNKDRDKFIKNQNERYEEINERKDLNPTLVTILNRINDEKMDKSLLHYIKNTKHLSIYEKSILVIAMARKLEKINPKRIKENGRISEKAEQSYFNKVIDPNEIQEVQRLLKDSGKFNIELYLKALNLHNHNNDNDKTTKDREI